MNAHTATPAAVGAVKNAQFEKMLDLGFEARIAGAQAYFAKTTGESEQAKAKQARAKRRLHAMIDALTPAELKAFGQYRSAAMK